MTKIIKPMYLFFDYLYESLEQIGAEVLADWLHKETPELKYCVIDAEDAEEKELATQWAWVFDNEAEALAELKGEF